MTDDHAESGGSVPPSGWEIPEEPSGPLDTEALGRLFERLLEQVPDELRTHLTQALRALLQALRALIDWLLERLERRAAERPSQVRDIPIL